MTGSPSLHARRRTPSSGTPACRRPFKLRPPSRPPPLPLRLPRGGPATPPSSPPAPAAATRGRPTPAAARGGLLPLLRQPRGGASSPCSGRRAAWPSSPCSGSRALRPPPGAPPPRLPLLRPSRGPLLSLLQPVEARPPALLPFRPAAARGPAVLPSLTVAVRAAQRWCPREPC